MWLTRIFVALFVSLCVQADNLVKDDSFPYASNPFLNNLDISKPAIPIGPPHHIVGKKHTLNQYQVAVLLPGSGKDGDGPSYANVQGIPHEGGIWINIPSDYYDQRGPYRPPKPITTLPPPVYQPAPSYQPPVYQPAPSYQPPVYQPPSYQPPMYQPPPTQKPPPTTTTTVTYPTYPVTTPPTTTYRPYTPPTATYVPPVLVTVGTTPDPNLLLKWCLKPIGQFPSRYCNKFVNCWDGNAVEQFCPPTLVFNPKGYCDYDYNVDCAGKPIEAFPTEAPHHGGGKWPSDGSYVPPHPPQGEPHPPTGGTIHYPVTTSKPRPIVEPITPPYQPPITIEPPVIPQSNPSLKKYCLYPRGQFPGTRCNTYANCWDDVVIEERCPDNLVFNGAKGWCDFPENVYCLDRVIEPYPIVPPYSRGSSDYQEKQCSLNEGTFRSAENCSQYYTCSNGKMTGNYDCPTGYVFNDIVGVCDHPHKVDCTREPYLYLPWNIKSNIPQNIPGDLFNPHVSCEAGKVIRLDPECVSAAICRSGITEVIQCPKGLSYDSVMDKCIAPHLARC